MTVTTIAPAMAPQARTDFNSTERPPETPSARRSSTSSASTASTASNASSTAVAATTISMIDALVQSIVDSGDHMNCASELNALVDIATFKDCNAHDASLYAEGRLMAIYASPIISSETRRDMIKQLVHAQDMMSAPESPNAHAFAMPASLLHLTAQYARGQIAREEADVVLAPAYLESIKLTLAETSNLYDEYIVGRDLADSGRFITTDEVRAVFEALPCGYDTEINLSDDVCVGEKKRQWASLLDAADQKGFVVAPLLIGEHFSLIAIRKIPESNSAHYDVDIANTNVAPGGAAADASNDAILKKLCEASIHGRPYEIDLHNAQMQEHAINSCGPLVSLLAKHLNAAHKAGDFDVKDVMRSNLVLFENLKAQQQIEVAMVQRSVIIGATVSRHSGSRFVYPNWCPPHVNEETEVTHL